MLVSSVLEYHKDFEIVTLKPSSKVSEAAELINEYNIGVIPIVENDEIVGVFSERDIIKKIFGNDLDTENTLISDVMVSSPNITSPNDDVFDAILSTIEGGYRHVLIGDENKKLLSVLSHRDLGFVLWNELRKIGEFSKYTLKDILELRGSHDVMTLSSKAPISEAIFLMFSHNFGAVPIVDNDKLTGIVSERDIIKKVLGKKLDPDTMPIATIMTKNPDTVSFGTSVGKIVKSDTFKKYRHLLVVDDEGKLQNILSLRDFITIPYSIWEEATSVIHTESETA